MRLLWGNAGDVWFMTDTLQSTIMNELGESGVKEIAGVLGTDEAAAQTAVGDSLEAILGGLAKNTEEPQGASELYSALGEHKDANPMGDIAALSSGGIGGAILGHVLGGKMDPVANTVSEKTGVKPEQVKQVLAILAPIVMSIIAKKAFGQGKDADGVAQDLQNEPSASGGLGGLLSSILGGAK